MILFIIPFGFYETMFSFMFAKISHIYLFIKKLYIHMRVYYIIKVNLKYFRLIYEIINKSYLRQHNLDKTF